MEILKIMGQIAGIGGLVVGVFLLLTKEIIRKRIFPKLDKKQAYKLLKLILILAWLLAILGIGSWVYVSLAGT